MLVKVKRIGDHSLPLPKYETAGASGFDLRAVVSYAETKESGFACGYAPDTGSYVVLYQGDRISLSCGFAFEVPAGHELQVRPRSGLSAKGIAIALGTVDSDYRGVVRVVLTNTGTEHFIVTTGDRVAQGVIAPVVHVALEEADELSETDRGGNGFGSTGSR